MGGLRESSDDGGAREDVGIDDIGPANDLQRAGSELLLHGTCKKLCQWSVIGRHGWGRHLLPMSPNLRSSKTRKCFLAAISFRPSMVRGPKSLMMSACVLSMHIESPTSSASCSSSLVVDTSAETQRFVCFAAINRRRYEATGDVLGSEARSWYDWVIVA